MIDESRLPYCEAVEQRTVGNFYLTGSRWHNEFGSDQPETGIRDLQHPTRFIPYETCRAVAYLNDPSIDFTPSPEEPNK